jgi:hypothetical protein
VDAADDKFQLEQNGIEAWQSLVHVCRRWRSVVFGSPRHLDVRLVYTGKKPVKVMLDVWPSLLLYIQCCPKYDGVDNIIAALEHSSDRVCRIDIKHIPSSQLERVLSAMQVPFPELTHLELVSSEKVQVLPDSFLGRSAPRLRILKMYCMPFPGFPNLLSSFTHLVTLGLWGIPRLGYISPEAIVAVLSTLTRLEILLLRFESSPERASQHLPLQSRSVLPVLAGLSLQGVSEDLEDLVARFNAPQLKFLDLSLIEEVVFDAPQLIQFISRTPKCKAFQRAFVDFEDGGATVRLSSFSSRVHGYGELNVNISSGELDQQISSLARLCNPSLPSFSMLKDLYIDRFKNVYLQDNFNNVPWLELLRPFGTVKNLYLSEDFAPHIVPALQELVGERSTEVLPTLQNIFLGGRRRPGPVQEGIRQFVATRQVAGHPIAVFRWFRQRDDGEENGEEDDDEDGEEDDEEVGEEDDNDNEDDEMYD